MQRSPRCIKSNHCLHRQLSEAEMVYSAFYYLLFTHAHMLLRFLLCYIKLIATGFLGFFYTELATLVYFFYFLRFAVLKWNLKPDFTSCSGLHNVTAACWITSFPQLTRIRVLFDYCSKPKHVSLSLVSVSNVPVWMQSVSCPAT